MCGIAGFVGSGTQDDLKRMTQAIAHRGPDDAGHFIDDASPVYLGHRRLSIIDIAHGHQPMWNQEQSIGVVFNGEIYNHQELKNELQSLGYKFQTDHCDTEVLVHGYSQWGQELPLKLNGMFAFAIYDRGHKQLFLARDRFGEKPLYYAMQKDTFFFGSELGAITAHTRFAKNINVTAVQKYFAYGFIPSPHAFYQDSFKLPAGYRATYDISQQSFKTDCYWSFAIEPNSDFANRSEDDLAGELSHLLSQSVKRRLMSDVPLGVFLSGGIDSSAMLAMAARHTPASRIQSFTIGFNEKSFDESTYAQEVANHIGSHHHQETLDLTKAQNLLPEVLSKLSEPLGDPSLIPTYLLCRFTRKHVKVALSGDGGDELFAGYEPFSALSIARLYQTIISPTLHKGVKRLVDLLPISGRYMSLDYKLRRALTGLSYARQLWNPVWLGSLEPSDLQDLLQQPVAPEDLYSEAVTIWNQSKATHIGDKTLEFYSKLYLPDNILTKTDRASMMVSLESRAPFLDNDLAEFARRLPFKYKYRWQKKKYLLKLALMKELPHNILFRKKQGFGIPVRDWLRQIPKASLCYNSNFCNQQFIENRLQTHQQGSQDHRLFLWNLLALNYAGEGKDPSNGR
ncbi:MAG: asparagine synthase (glutamine-hydrolyzing) [Pseudomonadota bacterium]